MLPTPEIIWPDRVPVTPSLFPRPAVGRPAAENPLPRLGSTAEVTARAAAATSGPDGTAGAARLRRSSSRRCASKPWSVQSLSVTRRRRPAGDPVFAPAAIGVRAGGQRAGGERSRAGNRTRSSLSAGRDAKSSRQRFPSTSRASPRRANRPAMLPCGRPCSSPGPDRPSTTPIRIAGEPRFEPPQAPRITIGRVTVALEPDPGPTATPVRVPRTAATASVIGPLGNRRARRRLFALARL